MIMIMIIMIIIIVIISIIVIVIILVILTSSDDNTSIIVTGSVLALGTLFFGAMAVSGQFGVPGPVGLVIVNDIRVTLTSKAISYYTIQYNINDTTNELYSVTYTTVLLIQ